MTAPLTRVALVERPDLASDRLRFGVPVAQRQVDRRRALAWFAPGVVFGFVRWRGGDFGTVLWRLWVLRALAPGEAGSTLAGVHPGTAILLAVVGPPQVRRAMDVIAAIEAEGVDPASVAESYWRHVHNRLAVHQAPRSYGLGDHRTCQARLAAAP